jgi:nitrous oxidase accessory protein NosD
MGGTRRSPSDGLLKIGARVLIALGVFVLLGVVALGHWRETQSPPPLRTAAKAVLVHVTNAGDKGPGTLREALLVVATATGQSVISIEVPKINLESALPAFVNGHGVKLLGNSSGVQIDGKALAAGPVFDIAGPNMSIDGITIRNCPAAAILVRSVRFHLTASTIVSCDVGVEVADNASDALLEGNRFIRDRLGVRFGAAGHNSAVANNEFREDRDAGLWAVRGTPASLDDVIAIHDNRFTADGIGVVAGNIAVLVERNEFIAARDADIHLVGAGAVIRENRIKGGASMGIVAEKARGADIDRNDLEGLAAYGVMVRGSSNMLVRGNRLHNCGYGLAFVLGDAREVSTVVGNTIIEPKFNGIDVIGDSPIFRHNEVLRAHAYAFHVEDYHAPDGRKTRSQPILDDNNFGNSPVTASSATVATQPNPR